MGHDFVPEADAEEQAEPANPGADEPDAPLPEGLLPVEAPEADVLEQAAEVPEEDDDDRR